VIAAGAVFCAVFVVALTTWPGHGASSGSSPDHAAAGDSARFTQVDNASTLAPPASVTRDPRRRPETISAMPELGQPPARGGSGHGSGPAHSGGPSSPGSSDSGSGGPAGDPGGPAPSGSAGPPSSGLPSSGPPSSGLPDPAQVAQAVFDAINSSRHAAGRSALRWDGRLQTSAQRHNQAMANANALSHQTPGEADLGQRESNAGVWWWWAGENIGMSSELTQQAALGLESAMVNEPPPNDGHRQNILSRNAQAVGVAVLLDSTHHRLWLTEDFAQTSLL
jgi:uncharacterized protein YkwD